MNENTPTDSPHFALLEKIFIDGGSAVYKGMNAQNKQTVAIKIPIDLPFAKNTEIQYKNDQSISALLSSAYVQKCLDLVSLEKKPALILEYIDAIPLKAQIPIKGFPPHIFLPHAVQIASGLCDIHAAGLIHKDISSRNILLTDAGEIKFSSFGNATRNARELIQERESGFPGSLEYIAPEQTGRLNRWVSARTDLYALGIIFYEMLIGHLPFRYSDPDELLYAHIALPPVIDPSAAIPDFLKQIVLRLLVKDPDQRYKSAQGLLSDLQAAKDAGPDKYFDPGFSVASHDPSTVLNIPEKLFGREIEVEKLKKAFERIRQNMLEILIVKGYSGIGKTALLFELTPLVAAAKGYMISGKFDQFQRNIPYSALIEAYKKLIKQLLTEGEASIKSWKNNFLEALGSNARLIAEVIPELELITGPLPEVETLSATSARNRFVSVFKSFTRSFANEERPFVIFLDDLQWADQATLQLLQDMLSLVEPDESHHILLVGSYRDNEVHAAHPLLLALEYLKTRNLNIQEIKLVNLNLKDVNQLVAETLELFLYQTKSLAELVHRKTSGNPFFINQFLHNLYDEGLLRYQHKQGWQWDLEKINAKNYTDNVVEFVSDKIHRLNTEQQKILQVAACIGNVFNASLVAKVADLPIEQVQTQLATLVNEGLLSVSYQVNGQLHHFLHDRIQNAALTSIHENSLKEIQYRLGSVYKERVHGGDEDKIFDLVNSLNPAIELLKPSERNELAIYNYQAALKAKRANAYAAATGYLQTIISILPDDKWQSQYRLTCDTYTLATECAYLTGSYDLMEQQAQEVLQHADQVLEKTFVYEIVIQSYGARYKLAEALATARKALRLLNINLPHKPSQARVMAELMYTMFIVGAKTTEDLERLPPMQDANKLAALRILSSSISSAYLADPNLFPIIAFMNIRLTVQYGNSKYASYSYVTYGVIFIGALNQIDKGYDYVKLGIRQLDQYEYQHVYSKTLFAWYGFSKHWKEPIHNYLDDFVKAYKFGLESGDLEYALWNMSKHLTYSFLSGVPIQKFSEKMRSFIQSTQKMQQVNVLVDIWYTQASIISGQDDGSNHPLSPVYIDRFQKTITDTSYFTAIGEHYLSKSMLCFYDGHYAEALDWVKKASKYEQNLVGTYYLAILVHYQGMALVKNAIHLQKPSLHRSAIKKVLSRLKLWAKHSPGSHAQRYEMVLGGYLQSQGNLAGALKHYQQAIEISRKYSFYNDEAIACHMAADCMKAAGIQDAADKYYQLAYAAYRQWGAMRLADNLALSQPKVLAAQKYIDAADENYQSSFQTYQSLDLNTILKSSQAISGEIEQEQLFAKLIEILIQNAGAQKVSLLMDRQGMLVMVALRSPQTGHTVQLSNLPLAHTTDLPHSIIEYVSRTREALVMHDARQDNRFQKDPYMVRTLPVSVLCFPLLNKGKRAGIIYMENNLSKGVFTADRLKVLQLLSSQIVVSEENARLYQEVKAVNQSYERFVPKEFLEVLNKESILQIVSGDSVEQDLTVMFTDIRNFTGFSEQIAAADTFRFLNDYLQTVGAQISANKGIIDKYLGDGILALFPGSADDALQASVNMRKLIIESNQMKSWSATATIQAGFGIHTGRVMLGTLGVEERLSTTIVGDTVNMAARLEAATKQYEVEALVSEETVNKLSYPGRFHLRRIDRIQVKGKKIPITVYEEFSHESDKIIDAKEKSKAFLYAGLDALDASEWSTAQNLFSKCLEIYPEDNIARHHLEMASSNI